MKINIVKRKASSLREIGNESIEINDASTLQELLVEICRHEYNRRESMKPSALSQSDIENQSTLGKITFGEKYNDKAVSLENATETMLQDYRDGMFRVFFNKKECTSLDEKVQPNSENELVLIRLVMLAGRLW